MKRWKSVYKEQDSGNSQSAVQALIDMQTIDTPEEKGKFLELMQGLVYANNPVANEFLNAINNFTSSLNVENYQ